MSERVNQQNHNNNPMVLAKSELKKVRKEVEKILASKSQPYTEMKRDPFDGPIRIGRGLKLREDFYSAVWLHQLRIEVITGGFDPTQEGNEPSKKSKDEEKETEIWLNDIRQQRRTIFGKFIFLIVTQLILMGFLLHEENAEL